MEEATIKTALVRMPIVNINNHRCGRDLNGIPQIAATRASTMSPPTRLLAKGYLLTHQASAGKSCWLSALYSVSELKPPASGIAQRLHQMKKR
jgi:hypothetical protein